MQGKHSIFFVKSTVYINFGVWWITVSDTEKDVAYANITSMTLKCSHQPAMALRKSFTDFQISTQAEISCDMPALVEAAAYCTQQTILFRCT
jgi:hypothetical protein